MADADKVANNLKNLKKNVLAKLSVKKKIAIILVIALGGFFVFNSFFRNSNANSATDVKSISVAMDNNFEFSAKDNQGKAATSKVKMKISKAEKTNQVLVKDQSYTARNNKLFLILNLELKNDVSHQVNLLPGDLVRVTYNGDEENKFAPDLHNNLVPIAAISTKNDRVGFVIPQDTKEFKVYVGELEGKKEIVTITFPS